MLFQSLSALVLASALAHASPLSTRCTGTISSYSDVSEALKCTTVNIKAFTVPKGTTLKLAFLEGTTINQSGDITFATGTDWEGPLAQISGNNINFKGNGYKWNGNGAYYWDGKGGNGGRTKPHPAMKITSTGTMSNLYLLNAPAHGFSVSNKAALTLSGFTVDGKDGRTSGLGHNTDGFDVSGSTGLTITKATVDNQDDCLAVNDASDLTFSSNVCKNGHGISIGSIKDGKHVKNVKITGNTITDSTNALRIKTYKGATDASVENIVYNGNTASGITEYGVVIHQDYTNEHAFTGDPSNTVSIKTVSFTGSTTSIKVNSDAQQVYVLCGSGSCTGTWDWSKLSVSGGEKGSVSNAKITGWSP